MYRCKRKRKYAQTHSYFFDSRIKTMSSARQYYKIALLSAKVLGKRTITSTINAAYPETVVGSDKTAKDRIIIEIEDGETRIALNKNNANALIEAYGDDYDEWNGKKVRVTTKPETYMGQPTMGLNVQSVKK